MIAAAGHISSDPGTAGYPCFLLSVGERAGLSSHGSGLLHSVEAGTSTHSLRSLPSLPLTTLFRMLARKVDVSREFTPEIIP